MADRSFIDSNFTLIKREVKLYAAVQRSGLTFSLMKWVYPTLGKGTAARTYVAAPLVTSALPSGNANPRQYAFGAEGVLSATRTSTGLYAIKLQDNYQRLMGVSFITESATGAVAVSYCSVITPNMAAAGGAEFSLQFYGASTVAADLADGDRRLLTFTMADATES